MKKEIRKRVGGVTEKLGICKELRETIPAVWGKHKKEEYDTVWCIVGDEGTGKSSLAAWILHYWQNLNHGKVMEDDARHMCLDREMWLTDLKDGEKFDCTVYDEADLLSRRAMDGFNVSLMRAYQIIRADCLLTILVLPSLWDLDTFFRKRRVRGLFYVRRRGRFSFWSKTRLRRMVALNSKLPWKNYDIVRPTFHGWFAKYDGEFEEKYRANKQEKIRTLRKDLYDEVMNPKKEKTEGKYVRLMKDKLGLTFNEIAKGMGMCRQTISNYYNEGAKGKS